MLTKRINSLAILCVLFAATSAGRTDEPDTKKVARVLLGAVENVPWDLCESLGHPAVPALLQILQGKGTSAKPSAVLCLGIVGGDEVVLPLISFLQKGAGRLSTYEYVSKASVPMALGILVNRTRNDQAYKYLESGTNYPVWQDLIKWTSPNHRTDKDRNIYMARRSMQALGLTATANAAKAIANHSCATDETCPLRDIRPQAAETCKLVNELGGVKAYFASQHR